MVAGTNFLSTKKLVASLQESFSKGILSMLMDLFEGGCNLPFIILIQLGGIALHKPSALLMVLSNIIINRTEPNILNPKTYMDVILCTPKNTRLEILDLATCRLFESCFWILRELWLELCKNY